MRYLNIDAAQIVHPGSLDFDILVPGTVARWHLYLLVVGQVFDGITLWIFSQQLFLFSLVGG